MTVKCVAWDLDGTVWSGVAVEAPDGAPPTPYPRALATMDTLEERGIVNCVASRTAPAMARVVEEHPQLAGRFVAVRVGWGHKSEAVAAIAAELGIDPAAVALVDDNPFERAEVAAVLPDTLVLAPADLYARLETPAFRPQVVTGDARHRAERYRTEQRRTAAAREFAGPREEFLRSCDIRLAVGPAKPSDVDRMAELVERTHRFNTTGEPWPAGRLADLATDPGWLVAVARLTDRFGDYGLVATALVARDPAGWRLRLLAVSCRAAGRDVPLGLLRWLLAEAARAGADRLAVDVRPSEANLELRLLLRGAGFTGAAPESGTVVLARPTTPELPPVSWLTVVTAG